MYSGGSYGLTSYRKSRSSDKLKYHGLYNQGSTCYLNSVLQVLFMTKEFTLNLHTGEGHTIDGELIELFGELKKGPSTTYKITQKLHINNVWEQRDAAEYFERILCVTSEEASKVFHGQMINRNTCLNCKEDTDVCAAFWYLPLPLLGTYGDYSVLQGVKDFFKTSQLSGENQMYCENCDQKCDATIKCVLDKHPEVLVLLLKRFDFNIYSMSYVKINCAVDVPFVLHIPQDQTYELFAFVDHSGNLKGGHYTTTIRCQDDDKWYMFDDTRISQGYQWFQVDNKERLSMAYLLFYRKRKEPSGTSYQDMGVVTTPGGKQVDVIMNKDELETSDPLTRDRPSFIEDIHGLKRPLDPLDHHIIHNDHNESNFKWNKPPSQQDRDEHEDHRRTCVKKQKEDNDKTYVTSFDDQWGTPAAHGVKTVGDGEPSDLQNVPYNLTVMQDNGGNQTRRSERGDNRDKTCIEVNDTKRNKAEHQFHHVADHDNQKLDTHKPSEDKETNSSGNFVDTSTAPEAITGKTEGMFDVSRDISRDYHEQKVKDMNRGYGEAEYHKKRPEILDNVRDNHKERRQENECKLRHDFQKPDEDMTGTGRTEIRTRETGKPLTKSDLHNHNIMSNEWNNPKDEVSDSNRRYDDQRQDRKDVGVSDGHRISSTSCMKQCDLVPKDDKKGPERLDDVHDNLKERRLTKYDLCNQNKMPNAWNNPKDEVGDSNRRYDNQRRDRKEVGVGDGLRISSTSSMKQCDLVPKDDKKGPERLDDVPDNLKERPEYVRDPRYDFQKLDEETTGRSGSCTGRAEMDRGGTRETEKLLTGSDPYQQNTMFNEWKNPKDGISDGHRRYDNQRENRKDVADGDGSRSSSTGSMKFCDMVHKDDKTGPDRSDYVPDNMKERPENEHKPRHDFQNLDAKMTGRSDSCTGRAEMDRGGTRTTEILLTRSDLYNQNRTSNEWNNPKDEVSDSNRRYDDQRQDRKDVGVGDGLRISSTSSMKQCDLVPKDDKKGPERSDNVPDNLKERPEYVRHPRYDFQKPNEETTGRRMGGGGTRETEKLLTGSDPYQQNTMFNEWKNPKDGISDGHRRYDDQRRDRKEGGVGDGLRISSTSSMKQCDLVPKDNKKGPERSDNVPDNLKERPEYVRHPRYDFQKPNEETTGRRMGGGGTRETEKLLTGSDPYQQNTMFNEWKNPKDGISDGHRRYDDQRRDRKEGGVGDGLRISSTSSMKQCDLVPKDNKKGPERSDNVPDNLKERPEYVRHPRYDFQKLDEETTGRSGSCTGRAEMDRGGTRETEKLLTKYDLCKQNTMLNEWNKPKKEVSASHRRYDDQRRDRKEVGVGDKDRSSTGKVEYYDRVWTGNEEKIKYKLIKTEGGRKEKCEMKVLGEDEQRSHDRTNSDRRTKSNHGNHGWNRSCDQHCSGDLYETHGHPPTDAAGVRLDPQDTLNKDMKKLSLKRIKDEELETNGENQPQKKVKVLNSLMCCCTSKT